MQRRRKKKTASKKPSAIYDKSLPSLPPGFVEGRDAEKPPPRDNPASPDVSSRNYAAEERTSSRGPAENSSALQPEQPQSQGKKTAQQTIEDQTLSFAQ